MASSCGLGFTQHGKCFLFFFLFCNFMACGIPGPWLGMKAMTSSLEAWRLNHWIAREVHGKWFLKVKASRSSIPREMKWKLILRLILRLRLKSTRMPSSPHSVGHSSHKASLGSSRGDLVLPFDEKSSKQAEQKEEELGEPLGGLAWHLDVLLIPIPSDTLVFLLGSQWNQGQFKVSQITWSLTSFFSQSRHSASMNPKEPWSTYFT